MRDVAAPAFAAAMLGRQTIGSIPIRRRLLLVAEIPVGAYSPVERLPASALNLGAHARLIGVRTCHRQQMLWGPLGRRPFKHSDTLIVVAARAGLREVIDLTMPQPG